MRPYRLRPRTVAWLLAAGALLLLYPACSFDTSGIDIAPGVGPYQHCRAEKWHCPPTTPTPLRLTIWAAAGHPQVAAYQLVPGLWENENQVYRPYHNRNWAFKDVADSVKGATLIATGDGDRYKAADPFLRVELQSDAEALYVGYDSRAGPPSWLTAGYTKQPGVLLLARKDPTAATPTPLAFDLWKWNGATTRGEVINIPGNAAGNPGPDFSAITTGKPLMYTVLVTPVAEVDCTTSGTFRGYYERTDCPQSPTADIAADTLLWCRATNPGLTCLNPSCVSGLACTTSNTIQGKTFTVRSYNVGSTVEFIAPSGIDATIAGEHGSAGITGTLGFSYGDDLTELTINDLVLNAGTVSTDEGPFENTSLVLWAPVTASCVGGPPAFAQPCTNYRINTGGLVVTVTTHFDGKDLLWLGESDQPIDITIDHTARTFQFIGRLNVSIIVNGDPKDLSAKLDLYGHITDVAPQAVGAPELPPTVECVEDLNDEPIVLDATGSFDVYSPSPTNLPLYEWYEDYGLVTEHLWGKVDRVVIPAGALAFGTHRMTLVVADQTGLVDTDTFDVEVVDTKPPVFDALPQDIASGDVYPAGTESVFVDLGALTARDACSGEVLVTHDGPPDGRFPPGVHTVTWTADDGRGNTTTATQRVEILALAEGFPWLWVIGGAAGLALLGAGALLLISRRRSSQAGQQPAGMEADISGPPGGPPPPPPPPVASWPWLPVMVGALATVVAVGIVITVVQNDDDESAATPTTTTVAPTTTEETAANTSTTILPPTTSTTPPPTTTSTTSPPPVSTTTSTTSPPPATTTTSTTPPPTTTSTTSPPPPTTTTTTTVPGPVLDPTAEPRYGTHKLIAGFLDDPATYAIYAGGTVDLEGMEQIACTGWAAPNPDLRLNWEGDTFLRFFFIPDDPNIQGSDTVLVINDPSNTWYCVDDSFGTLHPTVDFDPSQQGTYDIWVATYGEGTPVSGTLYITEFDGNHP